MNYKKWICFLACIHWLLLIPLQSLAIDVRSFATDLDFKTGPSEFVIQGHPSQKLITVRLLSGVAKPGLYRIPNDTDLVTLLSYSGGLSTTANVEKIVLKDPKQEDKVVYNLDELILKPKSSPVLNDNDILYIEDVKPAVSTDMLAVLSVVSSVVGILAIGYAIASDD